MQVAPLLKAIRHLSWPEGLALAVLGLVMLLAVLPWLLGVSATTIQVQFPLVGVGQHGFWLGTDDLGRDLLARLAVGAQLSLGIGLISGLVSVVIGGSYGVLAGLNQGWCDEALMRWVDIIYSLPALMVVILMAVFLEPFLAQWLTTLLSPLGLDGLLWAKLVGLISALALFSWPETARLIRGQVVALQQEQFIEAYRSLGGGAWRLVFSQLLPNLWPYLLLSLTLSVPRAILTESTLSFIGLGVEAPLSSWGTLASEGWYLLRVAPSILVLAAGCICFSMLAFQTLADGLKKRLMNE
jgi:ABC-type dipeptide/oligopeptide/nickel transport system permease subunit